MAPYNSAMRLGSVNPFLGFNSFTQQLCINDAVVRGSTTEGNAGKVASTPMAQEVSYKTSVIDKVTDVTNAMNINAAFSIKYDTFDAKGKGDFINTSKIKESDVSFLISVKVVNQVIYDHSLTKFEPIADIRPGNFAEVYGDCYISGFQEGGEFTAVISVKAKDHRKAAKIKANAAINFTKEKFTLEAEGDFGKDDQSFLEENETTVSVTWSGGGQDLKKPDEDWTLDTMRAAALKFPDLVAQTPMRTHVILTKYTALRSFHTVMKADAGSLNPNFEKAGVYTTVLQEAYLDFKTIAKNLQVLAFNVSTGTEILIESPAARKLKEAGTTDIQKNEKGEATESEDDDASLVAVGKPPRRATKPYEPTIAGLEMARQDARFMLNRIVAEVDTVTRKPELAVNETRSLPYLAPFLFKELLPEGKPAKESTEPKTEPKAVDTVGAEDSGLGNLAGKIVRV